MDDEQAALIKVRALRRDGYLCQHRKNPHGPICGDFSRDVGQHPITYEYVALCPTHAPQEALYVPALTSHRPPPRRGRRR